MNAACIALIIAQLADLLTTAVGVSLGARELNPFGFSWAMIAAKIAATLLVLWIMQYYAERLRWLVWIPVIASALVVPWNVYNIVLMMI